MAAGSDSDCASSSVVSDFGVESESVVSLVLSSSLTDGSPGVTSVATGVVALLLLSVSVPSSVSVDSGDAIAFTESVVEDEASGWLDDGAVQPPRIKLPRSSMMPQYLETAFIGNIGLSVVVFGGEGFNRMDITCFEVLCVYRV